MFELLENLCKTNGTSGDENLVREFIINEISSYCEYKVDALGSVLAFKPGKHRRKNNVLFSCHMDEVGFIITNITDDGYLMFEPVGGIDISSLISCKVVINNIPGIIGYKPIHLQKSDERSTLPKLNNLYIDIGAKDEFDAKNYVAKGDYAYFDSEFYYMGNLIKCKALDDRIGCSILINLIRKDLEYDTYFSFNVQEEIGLRGAKCISSSQNYDRAFIIEATSAADIYGVKKEENCCSIGKGIVVPFMDTRTLYNNLLLAKIKKIAKENNIELQTKNVIAGGNDAGEIQNSSINGCQTAAISVPCRYIHTSSSVVDKNDINEMMHFADLLINKTYD